ncbi:MAG: DNA-binding protein WhiA [Eubacterium sp.]|nr:DNA-binding protein WhiA [Eubacterium sp.]
MSFSSEVKSELISVIPRSMHCKYAELAGIIAVNGRIEETEEGERFIIRAENDALENKIRKLSSFVISEGSDYLELLNEKLHHRKLIIKDSDIKDKYFTKLKLTQNINHVLVNDLLTVRSCCKQSYLRGAFLAGGSVGSPDKNYQLSIICRDKTETEKLLRLAESLHLAFKLQKRNNGYAVYIKDGDTISGFLAAVGAANCVMEFENVRILKDIRNNVNREVNCDTANMAKTADAAAKQLDDIRFIIKQGSFDELPDNLKTVALARLEFPLLSIKELGEELSPQLSKSCINHRMRKISAIADALRKE